MDSVSRVLCTPEEMNSASLEKEVIQSGGNHATPKEGGPNSAKIFYESYSLRQDKKENTEASNNPREEWFSWEKADIGEKEGVKSFLGERIDSEGNRNRDQNVGLFYARLPNNEEEATSVQGVSAQNNPDLSTQLVLEPRERQSRSQHLSHKGFFTLPRNRRKPPYVDRGTAIATCEHQEEMI
ncbi:hypothetical protein Ancab_019392 [Ancistrocladus abbreviatus]